MFATIYVTAETKRRQLSPIWWLFSVIATLDIIYISWTSDSYLIAYLFIFFIVYFHRDAAQLKVTAPEFAGS